ncbi:MAG: hypothetical protein A2Y15_09380 [Clostridiales bacterium GWF2_36_10]|nr:MAG: hypothetical protein A2Y15_09380 [Clostridiales bacterium GWF2_36_10]HAN21410.1 hypothetical protein [Clostridiales bacterium]
MNDDNNNDNKEEKAKSKLIDDGRTIANMDVPGFRWHTPEKQKRKRKELVELGISKQERRAMIKGALLAIFPVVFAFITLFFVAFLIIHFWLT